MSDISLVLLAAGSSTRFSSELSSPCKKQFLRLGKDSLWQFVTKRLMKAHDFAEVIVVLPQNAPKMQMKGVTFVTGAQERSASLGAALAHVKSPWVMVSDVSRPLVPRSLINHLVWAKEGFLSEKEFLYKDLEYACISPALRRSDAVFYEGSYLDRNALLHIQTPQLSRSEALKTALSLGNFIDDSSAIASLNKGLAFIKGSEKAEKLTYKKDLALLKKYRPSRASFIGQGFDVHEFCKSSAGRPVCEDRELVLAGLRLGKGFGLKAHSDGDVVAHALCDALLGAAKLGDIGGLFPDSDAKNKGLNSMDMLRKVTELIAELGFVVQNADLCIICEVPRLGPFKAKMAQNLEEVLKAPVNVKASSAERLGSLGRAEGIAVLCNVSLGFFDWTKERG